MVRDQPSRRLTIRLALDGLVLSEFEHGTGEPGPEPHVHREHTDCFYVLDGVLTLTLSDGDREAGPGTFVLVPPNVAHTFHNAGPGHARFLNFHAPSMGFDRYLLDTLDTPFDQHPPPEDGGADPAAVIVRTAQTDSGELGGARVGFLADAENTLGALGLVEYTAPPSFPGPPAHLHERTWDAYYVLEGKLAVRYGDDRLELAPGDVAVVPPGTVHGFTSASDVPARFLAIHAPGEFNGYFRELAAALGGGPRDPTVLEDIASRYDMILV